LRNLDDGEREIVDAHARQVLERLGKKVMRQSFLAATLLTTGAIIII